ncbi:MAG: hypothetical protein JWO22_437, partial [Frankiales bacterium]|nr:hypothetical protein [Frankiales bacterium]
MSFVAGVVSSGRARGTARGVAHGDLAALWAVRHGESSGNVARDHAEAEGLERIALDSRDV